ncbi:MAG: YgjV family protein [Bacteroidales bacterium]|nr:YgjV family protein [Bacteroidales bacterium]MBN2748648.1 YgjV family protein [Bacteroidales bacterium]
MLGISLLEWLGYLASVLVAISLLMSSIVKLRWLNLVGSAVFSTYGFLIGALPVGFMNAFIVLINVYYLYKIYHREEYFRIQLVNATDGYLKAFITFYHDEITRFFPHFKKDDDKADMLFFVTRNMAVAGLFMGQKLSADTVEVIVDFAIPEYRDLKLGQFIFTENPDVFTGMGIKKLVCNTSSEQHINYLKKVGFTANPDVGTNAYTREF